MQDLFGNEVTPPYTRPNGKKGRTNQGARDAHTKLITLYGKIENEKCKNCAFLLKKDFSKVYYKCTKYLTGASISSDWRVGWQACGLFKREPG